jgi:hypothetical protein
MRVWVRAQHAVLLCLLRSAGDVGAAQHLARILPQGFQSSPVSNSLHQRTVEIKRCQLCV